jgi:uncharacterized integral membrane protein (TIGR00698 family)
MTALSATATVAQARTLFPGVMACAVVAAAATFLADHYHAPLMLFALLLGMAMNFLSGEGSCAAGIAFTGRTVLRSVLRCSGCVSRRASGRARWQPLVIVMLSVILTIGVSMVLARMMGFQSLFGLLSGGATAICGASAAMALAAALPNHPLKERATLFTVIGVSVLSTVTMIVYPMLATSIGLDPRLAGVFLGATIHDVAQVVGAGYGMSPQTGDVATLVKLMRVAMLLPVIAFAVVLVRARASNTGEASGPRPPLLPMFAVAFAVLVAINSTGWLPGAVAKAGSEFSRWCLVAAIAGIGMKTQLKELATVGIKPVVLMLVETTFLAALVLALMRWTP